MMMTNQVEHPQSYGAALPIRKTKGRQGRLNFPAICACLFLPWLLFCLMYSIMSFSLHYKEKAVCYLCVFFGLIFVMIMAKVALDSIKDPNPQNDPTWFVFLAVACFIAWLAGTCLGDLNYFYNMEPYYDLSNLNNYPSVDPSKMPGQQVMDAGQITFVPGSKLDFKKSMIFHNSDAYCVAPVVNSNDKSQSNYDFWVVGMNCCSGVPGDFSCGEYNNPDAASGLREMREDRREFFHLAVKQAEAAYNIKAKHPLFFHWMQDPTAELNAFQDEGFKYFVFGVYAFFAFLLFLVIVAIVCLSKA